MCVCIGVSKVKTIMKDEREVALGPPHTKAVAPHHGETGVARRVGAQDNDEPMLQAAMAPEAE